MKRKDVEIPNLEPDFRTMTEKDLRKGMSDINRALKEMRQQSDRYFPVMEDLIELRKRYKIVWRARPGRSFHDVAARKKREKIRRHNAPDYHFPFGM